jgi:hypothetical protein
LDVAADFQTSDEEYKLAQTYFSQKPKPKELMLGRRLLSAYSGTLKSGVFDTVVADYVAVGAVGGFDISINGTAYKIHDIVLGSAASLDDVAAAVQTRLQAALASVTCVHTASGFVVTSPTTGVNSVVGYATTPTTAGMTDISAMLGLTAIKGATRATGGAAEDLASSLDAFSRIDDSWYGFLGTVENTDDQLLAASQWAEANGKFHVVTYSNPVALDGSSPADLGSRLKALGLTHTLTQFSTTNLYAGASAAAKGFQVNYEQINSTITLEFKQEPNVAPENLTSGQYAALEAKNYCYLATVANGFVMIFNSKTASGRFFDEIVNIDWFTLDLQNNVFTALATSPTKVPQTDKGMEVLLQAGAKTCQKAIRNRMAAPGVWTHDGFGALATGDFVQQGYYLYALPVASQSDADRAARKTPPIQGVLIGANAFHGADIVFNYQR